MTRTRRTVTALTAAGALALGVLPAAFTTSAILAAGEGTTTAGSGAAGTSAGQLVLETGAVDRVRLMQGDTQVAAQDLSGNSRTCLLQSSGEALLDFSGAFLGMKAGANAASFSSDSIGVAEKKTGTSCARVDSVTGEVLTLSLGSGLPAALDGVFMDSASLDVELKQGARILATAYVKGDPVGYFDLAGAAVPETELVDPGTLPYEFDRLSCGDAADNGPDSGASDNCQWEFSTDDAVLFDSVSFAAVSGSFSLEGGSDWGVDAADHRSVIELASGLCVGDQITLDATDSSPAVVATRLGNADNSTGVCIPYAFSKVNQGAELLKSLTVEGEAQFNFDFVWTVDANILAGGSETTALVDRTFVDFDGDGDLDDPTVIASCPDLTASTIDGVDYVVVADVATNPDAPDLAEGYPAAENDETGEIEDTKQFACIVTQSIEPAEPRLDDEGEEIEQVTVKETIYAYGDIVLRKP